MVCFVLSFFSIMLLCASCRVGCRVRCSTKISSASLLLISTHLLRDALSTGCCILSMKVTAVYLHVVLLWLISLCLECLDSRSAGMGFRSHLPGSRHGSVVRTSVFGRRSFLDLCLL